MKWRGHAYCFMAAAIVVGLSVFTNQAYAADDFLKFHWKLDEGSGTAAADSSGNTPSYPGTLYNGPTWIPEGGISLDGINDYARTNSPIPNSMGEPDQAYTLSASVRIASGETGGNIIHISDGANGVGWCISMLHLKDGKFRAIGWENDHPVIAVASTTAVVGEWYSISNTWSPESGELRLYVNGELAAATPMATYDAADASVYVFAGIDGGGCDNSQGWFKGDVKDVRIYSRAISQEEAEDNSNASLGTISASLSPADDATAAAVDANLVMTFSTTTVATSTGSIGIYRSSDDSLVETLSVASGRISIVDDVVTIDPTADLESLTGYYVIIPDTAFVDEEGNTYPGTAIGDWNFTTTGTAQEIAMQKILEYADTDGGSTAPTLDDYVDAGVSGVASTTLSLVNAAISDSDTEDIDTLPELQALVSRVIAMEKIRQYALTDGTSPAPTLADYQAAGITDVTADTLDSINRAIAASDPSTVTSAGAIQSIVAAELTRIASESESSGTSKKGTSVQSRVENLLTMGNAPAASILMEQYPQLFSASVNTNASVGVTLPVRDLEISMEGEDVRALQTILIAQDKGDKAKALAGIGATGYFGTYTRDALAEYQGLVDVSPTAGYFGPLTRAQMKSAGVSGVWW